MNITNVDNQIVFDNHWAKPIQSAIPVIADMCFSVPIIFSVNGVLYYGQYDFVKGTWTTIPGDDKKRTFIDQAVEYWYYPPEIIDMMRRYDTEVKKGETHDLISRIDEYQRDGIFIKNTEVKE